MPVHEAQLEGFLGEDRIAHEVHLERLADADETRPGGIDKRFSPAWASFAPMLDRWLKVIEGHGEGPVKQVYQETLAGRVPPDQGHILSLAA